MNSFKLNPTENQKVNKGFGGIATPRRGILNIDEA